jgi:hypothetical protein
MLADRRGIRLLSVNNRAVDVVHGYMVDRAKGVSPDLIWAVDCRSDGQGCMPTRAAAG